MNNNDPSGSGFGIAVVERSTGLSKDTLRIWERRYGFPTPGRDANGERVYSTEQVERLGTIKRLMDAGHRPGRLIELSASALEALAAGAPRREEAPDQAAHELVGLLKAHDPERLQAWLQAGLLRDGLARFVTRTMPEANAIVGDAWMRGELAIFEEHLYSHTVQGVLRGTIQQMRPDPAGARVMLTTLPGESHGLGLLMLEAMLVLEGARCIALGTETPAPEIRKAAEAHRADVVALSFSEAFPLAQLRTAIADLAAMMPTTIDLWVGGAGVMRIARLPDRVSRVTDLNEAVQLVQSIDPARGRDDGGAKKRA